jgi:2-polyprenyl-6-methoxyphenol hydroxylase-like FAD-dependent oxidoreductase
MPGIGIVGAGISGLQLALRLQQEGFQTTLYADRSAEQVAAGPPLNLVVRFGHTRARERQLGVSHWNEPEYSMHGVWLNALGELELTFHGRLTEPGSNVDFRLYLPRLMADYVERGGTIEPVGAELESVLRLATRHDLTVVATGRKSVVAELFPRDSVRSAHTTPQRKLTAGFYTGIEPRPDFALHYQLCPGVGEIFSGPFLSLGGLTHGLNIEAVPGGPLEYLSELSYVDDPAGFRRAVLAELAEHAPGLRERIDGREFDLTRPIDLLQGGITPTVRTGWAELPHGGFAMAVGDAWVLNDPVTGQGANLGSHSAFVLADAILDGGPYDEKFCRRTEDAMWEFAGPVTEWTNAFLAPPPDHAVELLMAANEDPRIADAFVDNFNDPVRMWQVLGTPDGTATWLKEFV